MVAEGSRKGQRAEHNIANPTATWIYSKGFMLWYIGCFILLHLIILSVPVLTTAWAWTLTNLTHAFLTFLLFHWQKGGPVPTIEDASSRTQWEQIAEGGDLHWSQKFLFLFPAVPFLLAVEYSGHDSGHFWLNVGALLLCVIPKLPSLEGVRLFGINKY